MRSDRARTHTRTNMGKTDVTVFVRNLSFNVDDKTLSDAFAHIGPVKEAFVLKDKNKKHRGIGFVELSLAEDAKRAIEAMQDKDILGRRVKLDVAKPKLTNGKGKGLGINSYGAKQKGRGKGKGVAGPPPLPAATAADTSSALAKAAADEHSNEGSAKQKAKRKARQEAKERRAKKRVAAETAGVLSSSEDAETEPRSAERAVQPGQGQRAGASRAGEPDSGEPMSSKDGRLIIRNLPFQCKDGDIHKVFGGFGEIEEVKLPVDGQGRSRGFGFVQFTDAEVAKQVVNEAALAVKGRPVAVDFSIPKFQYLKLQKV
eukprot:SAG11_NODE_6360_length_1329_cov_0.796748_1_plen_315_part_10